MGSFSFLFFTSFLFTSVGLVYIASLMQYNMSTVIRCDIVSKKSVVAYKLTVRSKLLYCSGFAALHLKRGGK